MIADAHWVRRRTARCCKCNAIDAVVLFGDDGLYSGPVMDTNNENAIAFCDECLQTALKESGRV